MQPVYCRLFSLSPSLFSFDCLFIQSLSCLCSMSLESACSYLLPRMSLYSVSFLPLQHVSRISPLVPPAPHVSLFSLFPASAACLSNQPARTSCPTCLFIQSLSCLCSLSLESACSYLLPHMSLYSVSFLPRQHVSRISLIVHPA
jgi:hypothetical protein